ncbi:xaa-Pro aminopeptidase 1-like [Saccostrea cucullata]|uniref:xaa-Pro aminopeptidase 1-like n=1 Tax=Saccostrea cuccullata TaxID=36930 RepID=UPI002ED3995A
MPLAHNRTGPLLKKLRTLMSNRKYVPESIQAYIVPSGDSHQSEYIAPCDCRRAFISGFTGSAGTAVITAEKAALWTDGRYFLQAEKQLDENWTLMKDGQPSTPTQADWLAKELPVGGTVGVDPCLISAEAWKPLKKSLQSTGHSIIAVPYNLIDLVWEDQPPPPMNPLLTLSEKYTGMSWPEKIQKVREKMQAKKCGALVISALDEIAYLFNLRGSDIEYNPVFFAYAVVTLENIFLFIDEQKLDTEIKHHLQLNGVSSDLQVMPYDKVGEVIKTLVDQVEGKFWISPKSSVALTHCVDKSRLFAQTSPVAVMKAVKNAKEIQGMRTAHIKDAVTLCELFSWLEKQIPTGAVTEVSAADKLEEIKQEQDDFVSLSFATISSTGPNAAIIHYKPTEESDTVLSTDSIFLCDSGAQYKDGTTDVTRTIHFGVPSSHEKECYTRVLKGHIGLSSIIFPNETKGHMLDTLARTALWEVGLDYAHGTGHGVGAFLNVHEGPCGISPRVSAAEIPLEAGMILSDEPGYYEDGKFGVRIENLVLVVKAETKHNFRNKGFLTFEPLTLVPMQLKMIEPSLLTEKEISWLNDYHTMCRDIVGPELKRQGKKEAYDWMMRETQSIG